MGVGERQQVCSKQLLNSVRADMCTFCKLEYEKTNKNKKSARLRAVLWLYLWWSLLMYLVFACIYLIS